MKAVEFEINKTKLIKMSTASCVCLQIHSNPFKFIRRDQLFHFKVFLQFVKLRGAANSSVLISMTNISDDWVKS